MKDLCTEMRQRAVGGAHDSTRHIRTPHALQATIATSIIGMQVPKSWLDLKTNKAIRPCCTGFERPRKVAETICEIDDS